MDYTQLVLWGLGAVCTVLGWFLREIFSATQQLKQTVNALEIKVSSDYVRYDRMQDALKPVMDSLHEIKITLNGKADK